jgi:hypothetical protein
MVYSKALIQGEETSTGANTVRVNGADILVRFGYPRDNSDAALAVWTNNLLELDENEFIASRQNNGIVIVPTGITLTGGWPADLTDPQVGERNCYVQYRESDVVGEPPLILDVIPCL